jgi:hypothetical protein
MEIASDEIQLSWAQGFTHGWKVAEEYEITGGVLRGKGPSRHVYSPMMHPEIPGEVAKLRREDEAGVLEFARAAISTDSTQHKNWEERPSMLRSNNPMHLSPTRTNYSRSDS